MEKHPLDKYFDRLMENKPTLPSELFTIFLKSTRPKMPTSPKELIGTLGLSYYSGFMGALNALRIIFSKIDDGYPQKLNEIFNNTLKTLKNMPGQQTK